MGRDELGFTALVLDYDFVFGKADDDDFPICLSWRERQALLAIVDSLAWPTRWTKSEGTVDADEIEQLRNQIAYKLMGECSVDCAEVIQCILDDMSGEGDFSLAILAWLIDQLQNTEDVVEIIDGTGSGDTVLDLASVDLTSGGGCDLDDTFGFAMQMVEFIHKLVIDFYEVLEVTTNWVEAISATVEEVPLLTEVTDFIAYIQNNLYENYNANWDEALKIEYACELWCYMVREDCTLSWEDLVNYYRKKGFEDFDGTSIGDWMRFVILGTWESHLSVSVSHLTACYVLMYGGEWGSISLQDIQRIILSFFNDPDEDWDILCDTCLPWKATFDFTDTNCGWSILEVDGMQGMGVYIPANGWQHDDLQIAAEYRRAVSVGLNTTEFRLFETTATFDFTKGSYDAPETMAQQILASGDVEVEYSFTASEAGVDVLISKHTSQGKSDVVNLTTSLRCHSVFTGGYDGVALLTQFTVSGYGDIPQEIIDNATDVEYL